MNTKNILEEKPLNDLPKFYTGHPSSAFVDDVRNKVHSMDFIRLKKIKIVSTTIPAAVGIDPGTITESFSHGLNGVPIPFVYTALATEKLPITGVSADKTNIFFTGNNFTLSPVTVDVVIYIYEIIRQN